MNILANENLYDPIVVWLRSAGHNVIDTKRTQLAGAPDQDVYDKAVSEHLVIVTMDKDFSRMVRFPPERCGGIVVAKLYRLTVDDATATFGRHFAALAEDRIKGRLVVITRDGARVRASGSSRPKTD